jgi:hypothetical protein
MHLQRAIFGIYHSLQMLDEHLKSWVFLKVKV